MTPPDTPSPASTGGAGVSFEFRVGAIALGRLLRNDRIPGLNRPPTRVRLQQRFAGAVLDDIVIDAEEAGHILRTIEYQVKRLASPTAGDPDFADIVQRCITAFADDKEAVVGRYHQFGIASRPTDALRELARITTTARAHDSAESFLAVIRGTAARPVRDRLTQVRKSVIAALPAGSTDEVVDECTWRLAGALHVWMLDAEPDGSDVLAALDRLEDLLSEGESPNRVFDALVSAAQELAAEAGSVDLGALRARLEREGFVLSAAPRRAAAFNTLTEASRSLLDPSAATLGHRLHLPREPIRRQVREVLGGNEVIVLAGRAGVGKSMMARLVAQDIEADCASVVAVNLAGRTGGLAELEAELGVRLADALAGAPIGVGRLLIIDGAEQVLSDAGALLNAVLGAIPMTQGGSPPWSVLLTCRDDAVSTLTRLVSDRTANDLVIFPVDELTDDEIAEIRRVFPRLESIARNQRATALLLRRPFIVDLLVRSVERMDLPGGITGEEDVVDIVTQRLVRLDGGGLPGRGAPHARDDIYLQLADAFVANALPVRLSGTDAEARAGLASDDLITEDRSTWRFAHDVLADYAASTSLLGQEGAARLALAPEPRRLLRAARLRMQRQFADALSDGTLTHVWTTALSEAAGLAHSNGVRWNDLPYEALLNLGAIRPALQALTPSLLAANEAGLRHLLEASERVARRSLPEEVGDPLPLDVTLTAPVVDLLVEHAANLPETITPMAARLAHEHFEAAFAQGIPLPAGLEHAAKLPDALVKWSAGDQHGDRLRHVVGALALNGNALGPPHFDFLVGHGRSRPQEIAEAVESRWASCALAGTQPDLLLQLAGLYYLGRGLTLTGEGEVLGKPPGRTRSFTPGSDGVRDHSLQHGNHLSMWPLGNNQSNPALGPFAALLASSPSHGLWLIGAVVDAATSARAELEAGFGPNHLQDAESTGEEPPTLELLLSTANWAEPHHFHGPATAWTWHRRTGVGPGPALSALMALRSWGVSRIREGADVATIRDAVLAAGSSLAFVSVAVSILVDVIDRVEDELDLFLEHPLIWHLEIQRVTNEHGGLALDIPDALRLLWTTSQVAVHLVLHGSPERRQELLHVGEALVRNHTELADPDSEILVRRWAAELDGDRYVKEPQGDGTVAIRVDYPPGVLEALQNSGGRAATQAINLSGIMFRAVQLRDGQGDIAEAPATWTQAVAALEAQDDGPSLYSTGDVLSAAAGAALVMAAADGQPVDDAELRRAVTFLLEGAHSYGKAAPPENPAEAGDGGGRAREASMLWAEGADRSIAMSLPLLLLREDLCDRAGTNIPAVGDALEALAATPYGEARARLVSNLARSWSVPCTPDVGPHEILVRVARRLIATEGTSKSPSSWIHNSVTLKEPLEATIQGASDFIFDLAGASYGVRLLSAGVSTHCAHSVAASALLDVLIEYDQRAWPKHFARQRFDRYDLWRQAIDEVVAQRVLAGDDALLEAHLRAFAPFGEELVGFLSALTEAAADDVQIGRLLALWPRFLDHLLPQNRDLSPRDGDSERRPYHRDEDALDCALLLFPPNDREWTQEQLRQVVQLNSRWFEVFRGTPHVASRAIYYVAYVHGVKNDEGARQVLDVLGDNIEAIRRESRVTTAWLRALLTDPPAGAAVGDAQSLLDRLAASGHEPSISLQRDLEA